MADSSTAGSAVGSVDGLRARIAELEAENEALKRSERPRRPKPVRSLARTGLSSVLVIIGLLMGTTGLVAAYAKQQLLDTTNFVSAFAPLADDPAVQDLVSDAVLTSIDDAVDIPALTSDIIDGIRTLDLPPRADAALGLLEAPAAQGLQGFVNSGVDSIVKSDAFSATWEQALRISHSQTIAALSDSDEAAFSLADGTLYLQLGPIVAEVKKRLLDNGLSFAEAIPAVDRSIPLIEDTSLDQVRTAYVLVEAGGGWLPWISLALLVAGVLVARNRRKTVMIAAVSSVLLMTGVALAIGVARGFLWRAGDRAPGLLTGEALHSFFDAATFPIIQMALAIGTLALATALVAWITGPSRAAHGTRALTADAARAVRTAGERRGFTTGTVGEWSDAHHRGLVIALGVIGAGVILLTRPLSATLIVWTSAICVVAVVVLELIRRPAPGDGDGADAPGEEAGIRA